MLTKAGYRESDIPPSGQRVFLRKTSNLSQGGTSIDVTPRLHPDNKAAALLAAKVIGLDVAGVDFITKDVARSWKDVGGAICEVNVTPGLRMHFSPGEGEPRDVASPILNLLYPPGHEARIPMAIVTGSNGKTTTTRLVAHILREAGACVGVTCTDGVYVDSERIRSGDFSGGPAAQQLMIDPRIDAAVLEIARGAILRYGAGVDGCDVTVVTNIADEHLGELGLNTKEDLARVKGMLVELASEMVVLGADDPLTAGLAKRSGAKRLCYVSFEQHNQLVSDHIAAGHPALRLEPLDSESCIALYDNGECLGRIPATDIPVSLGGLAVHNLQNAMCAAAVAYGLGYEPERIAVALRSFKSDSVDNPGRLNLVDGLDFNLILDYCHNRHGLAALGLLTQRLNAAKRFLVYSMPGNRRESDFEQVMQVAAKHFDRFHLFPLADKYLRGRTGIEITNLLAHGLRKAGISDRAITEHASQDEALDAVLGEAQAGDLVLVATLQHDMAWQLLERRQVAWRKPSEQ